MHTRNTLSDRLLLPWSAFNTLGRSRVVKSSYLWAAFVPIAAKMLSAISQDFQLSILSTDLHIVLGVPFTWEILYYSSVFFALATLTYVAACPEIVRRYDKYSDFAAEGKGSDQLVAYALGITSDRTRKVGRLRLEKIQLLRFVRNYGGQHGLDPNDINQLQTNAHLFLPDRVHVTRGHEDAAFWFIRNYADHYSPFLRGIVQVLYGAGFALFAWVMGQNFWFVFSHHFAIHG